MTETFRDEGGRQVAGPELVKEEFAKHRSVMRRYRLYALGFAVWSLVVLSFGFWFGVETRQDLAALARAEAPCTVQVLGTEGTENGLDTVEGNIRSSAPDEAELTITRSDGYLVAVAVLCPTNEADPMEGV